LIEVLLATSILLGCVVVLAQLARIGRRHAESTQDLSTAQLLCQSKLNELLAGASPAEPVQSEPFEDHPGWVYSLEVSSAGQLGMTALSVTVAKDDSDRRSANQGARPAKQFTLVRWVRSLNRGAPAPRSYSRTPAAPVELPPPPEPVLYGGPSR
jgi:hypothetical protein